MARDSYGVRSAAERVLNECALNGEEQDQFKDDLMLLANFAISSLDGPNERIKQLEKAIRDANDWLNVGEGVDLTYYALDSGANGSESWKVLSRLIHESAPTLDARDATGESK